MYKYAQISNNVVVGTQESTNLINHVDMVAVASYPNIGDVYENEEFVTPAITDTSITINGLVNGVTFLSASTGDTVNFTASFSDETLNIPKLEISVVDRTGGLIENLSMVVIDGEGTGSLIVDKKIDYLVTNAGINFHKQAIPVELKLVSELVVRVS